MNGLLPGDFGAAWHNIGLVLCVDDEAWEVLSTLVRHGGLPIWLVRQAALVVRSADWVPQRGYLERCGATGVPLAGWIARFPPKILDGSR